MFDQQLKSLSYKYHIPNQKVHSYGWEKTDFVALCIFVQKHSKLVIQSTAMLQIVPNK